MRFAITPYCTWPCVILPEPCDDMNMELRNDVSEGTHINLFWQEELFDYTRDSGYLDDEAGLILFRKIVYFCQSILLGHQYKPRVVSIVHETDLAKS